MYSLSSGTYMWCQYYNTGCLYSDMGTEYGHPRNLLNKKIKVNFKITKVSIII